MAAIFLFLISLFGIAFNLLYPESPNLFCGWGWFGFFLAISLISLIFGRRDEKKKPMATKK